MMAATTEPTTAPTSQASLSSLLRDLLPPQGAWGEREYLWLTDHTNRLIELAGGHVLELPMPTDTHQAVLLFLYLSFHGHLESRGGVARVAPLRLRVRADTFREPDLLLLRDRSDPRRQDRYWLGADLVGEVVSPDDPDRDLVAKRADYAAAGVPEYWIADPRGETITVLTLKGGAYAEHGTFARGESATSPLLAGFTADVSAVFDAPESGS